MRFNRGWEPHGASAWRGASSFENGSGRLSTPLRPFLLVTALDAHGEHVAYAHQHRNLVTKPADYKTLLRETGFSEPEGSPAEGGPA